MAQGFLQSFDKDLEVYSAGTFPGNEVNTIAIRVMAEAGIDISHHYPKSVDLYLNDDWDYVITVCDDANETCPVFAGKARHRLHIPYIDPSFLEISEEFKLQEFYKLRDRMKNDLYRLYIEKIKPEMR
jgi:arsenate reductase